MSNSEYRISKWKDKAHCQGTVVDFPSTFDIRYSLFDIRCFTGVLYGTRSRLASKPWHPSLEFRRLGSKSIPPMNQDQSPESKESP
jgi:hypothetical protein